MNQRTLLIPSTLSILIILIIHTTIYSQARLTEIKITGKLVDSLTRKPVIFASIQLTDSVGQILQQTISDSSGNISFAATISLKYTVLIMATGYQTKLVKMVKDSGKIQISLGTIELIPQINELKEVTITTKIPLIKQEVDKIIYNLQADPDSKIKNLLEMLRKLPYLSMDGEENLLLKGTKNYRIFINGKPSGMMENNPKEVLRTIPASTIQRIEIITNPSAKYDAEGSAGIINIITIKRMTNGYAGNLSMYQRAPVTNTGLGTSFTTKSGKWFFSTFAGINHQKVPSTNETNSLLTENMILLQSGQKTTNAKSGYVGVNASLELNHAHLITFRGSTHFLSGDGNSFLLSAINSIGGNIQQYQTNIKSNGDAAGSDAGVDWQIKSKKNKSRLFTFSYQYIRYRNKQESDILLSDKLNVSMPDFRQDNKTINVEHTAQADFVQAIKTVNMEAGVKAIFRNNHSYFKRFTKNNISNSYEIDNLGSNMFSNTQNIVSVYNNYQFGLKSWRFQAGIRMEQTTTSAYFISNTTSIKQQYLNIISSISINKDLKNKANLNLGFSQRIKRPGINRLNPFVDKSNPNFESTGNPDLQPVVNYDIMLGYSVSKKVNYNISIGYSFSNNVDLKVSTFNPVSSITFSTYENTGYAGRLGIDYNVNYPVNNKLTLSLNGNFARFWIRGFADNRPIENNMFTFYMALNTNYRFKNGWQLGGEMNAISKNPAGLQNITNGFIGSSLSVNKSLFNNALSVSLYANNLFTKYRNNNTSVYGYNFQQVYSVREYFRAYGLNINYTFGKLKDGPKKSRRSIRNDDISN